MARRLNGRPIWYILDAENNPVPVEDPMDQIKWEMEDRLKRIVKQDTVEQLNGESVFVSTVFLGMDTGMFDEPLRIFETMIFGGDHDQYQERYATWGEALLGHDAAMLLAAGKATLL